ncbi:polysaccharide deacetylase [Paenibacillus cremeus]|uniref:Polysaccharide deacetylase family protein n=1 Tax=Paenibacillus cremeus TaxID=2163881 RepID=A0A559JPR1_9BACL|nr:polysaccharide deacetylase [Paenibacillus cremeus]TVY01850.1 polysaccharide deacetylase family protein [Paenibacillus cremeus]
MMNGQQGGLQRAWKKAVTWVCCIPLLGITALPGMAWAGTAGEDDPEAVFAAMKAGKHVELDKSYTTPVKPTVYLTFDDGPSKLTPQVLDILKAEEVKGTFFVLGQQVEAQPDIAARIVNEGHAIGNHSYNHVYNELYSDFSVFWKQIQRTENIINAATGVTPRLLRAPGGTSGNFDPFYFYFLDQAGYEVHDWNIDSGDSTKVGVPASEIYQTVQKGPFRHEVIVLMHDSSGHGESVKALPKIIRLFKERGYDFASLTPEVKPVHGSNGKPKWSRSLSRSSFNQFAAAAAEHRQVWAPQQEAAPEPEAPPAPPTPAPEDIGPEQLSVRMNESASSLELSKGQFLFHGNSFYVPLRPFVEAMGAKVEWVGDQRIARVTYGLYTAEYDLGKQELRLLQPRGSALLGPVVTTVPLPGMQLKEGTIYVPLRQTVELFGHTVTGYEAGEGSSAAVVTIQLQGSLGLQSISGLFKRFDQ